jgi:hypothetical protein
MRVPWFAALIYACSLVCLSARRASNSGAQHDVPVSSMSCSRSSGRVKILQETNKGSCTLGVDLAERK